MYREFSQKLSTEPKKVKGGSRKLRVTGKYGMFVDIKSSLVNKHRHIRDFLQSSFSERHCHDDQDPTLIDCYRAEAPAARAGSSPASALVGEVSREYDLWFVLVIRISDAAGDSG